MDSAEIKGLHTLANHSTQNKKVKQKQNQKIKGSKVKNEKRKNSPGGADDKKIVSRSQGNVRDCFIEFHGDCNETSS